MKDRILVIDDEEGIRFTLERFLVREGYEVETAAEYDEAIQRIGQADFDLIFADILLGGMTGIDILRDIRGRNILCPVIMITGYPNLETATEAIRLGAFDYIPKPVQKEMLLHVAGLALQHKKVIDEKEKYRSNLEAIFRSVKDGIITVDKDMQIVEVNEAAENICHISRDMIGRKFITELQGCSGKCLETMIETIEKKQAVEVSRFECRYSDRPEQVVTLTASPLLDRQGFFSGAVLVVKDETRLADLERDLNERQHFHNIIGSNEAMQKVYTLIEDLADVQTTVLITGESGTGKELVAEALHYRGGRSGRPLVKVNCAALSENLLESELFGHVRGAFTGAIKDKMGRFQRADGGTIFLDEIGDISPGMQSRLLRVLQEMEFERVGDSTPIRVDVRVIAATNKDLREKVRDREFREDLYYRLKVVEIGLPPLRGRREDIPLLIEHFIKKFNKKLNRNIVAVSAEAQERFMNYDWPGNIRELEHTLEHAFIVCRQNTIAVEDLPPDFKNVKRGVSPLKIKHDNELQVILQALQKTGWNKAKASRLLGISQRTIYRKINEYNIVNDESIENI